MGDAVFIYSDELALFDYGDNHPFKPIRARNTLELCNRYGLLNVNGVRRVSPPQGDPAMLELFHDADLLQQLKRASDGDFDFSMLAVGLGTEDCPVLPGIWEFCLNVLGATKLAVDLVLEGGADRAFNLVGGLHHGERDHAEGFCYINDVGVVLEELLRKGKRVAFVDIDAHHCNGVQSGFYDTDQVLTISLHETGRTLYPGTGWDDEIGEGKGRGFTVNAPLLEKTDDEVYVWTFRQIVPPLLAAYRPDLVIVEAGADTMISDPLTHLRLTSNGYQTVMKDLCAVAPKLVALGGGGYDIFRTAKCWTLGWAAMTGLEPGDDYAGMVGGMMYGADMAGLYDPQILTEGEDKERAWEQARNVVAKLQATVFPILGAAKP
ncbi:MAG: acetoin utilization protein AcuC [Myxococcales bacterium]|nr:MAG: acetoin utilization protein AcuC [Myxococcales bacterium]